MPPYLRDILNSHEINADEVIAHGLTDLSVENMRCDTVCVLTKSTLYVITGALGITSEKKTLFRRQKAVETFKESDFQEYSLSDFSKFSYEEFNYSAAIVGSTSTGEDKLLVMATNSTKSELSRLSHEMNLEAKDEATKESAMTHPPHGFHGSMPPHLHGKVGEDGKMSPKGPLYCPKCNKKYSDPARRICTNCMDKGKIIKRILSFVVKYKKEVILSILILLSTSALGILTPYISSGFFYDEVLNEAGKFYGQLILVLSLIIGTRLLSTLVSIVNHIVSSRIASKLQYDLKNVIFASIERLSLRYFTDKQTGALMTQVNQDAGTIHWFFSNGIPYFLINIVQIICIVIIMFLIQPVLTLMYLVTIPFIFFVGRFLFTKMNKYHEKSYAGRRRMNAFVSDTFSGMRVVKAFAKEEEGSVRFTSVNKKAAEGDMAASRFNIFTSPLANILMLLGNSLVLGFGGWMVIQNKLDYGLLLTFTAYTGMIYSPMQQFVSMSYDATKGLNAMNRLVEVMDAEQEIFESENPIHKERFDGDISFKDVNFGYDKSRLVLRDIDFDIAGGTILGVVGHTGAGKSTLANLLLRMYDVDSGDIRIDGHSIREIEIPSLRRNIAIVSQETYLFVGTILDNIRYARPDATAEEVIKASKISGAHDFIVKLPDGYQTRIGFGMRELSGGERQRLSIARAILQDPSILILDEATAAMDTQTERKIQNALEILIKGKTTIMIAHRLSTLRIADRLIVLKDGEICERGTHEELIRAKGEYFKLYSLQLAALKNVGVEE